MMEPRFASAALLVSLVLFSAARADAQGPSAPCCGIVAIDAKTGLVTVKVNATGNVFQFKPNGFSPIDGLRSNPALASLKPGQAVYANFSNHQVSLDGRTVCCTMTSGPHAATAAAIRPIQPAPIAATTPAAGALTAPFEPCCGIVAIDAKTGLVTVKVNATGNVFQFKPNRFSPIDGLRSNPGALASLKPGQAVYANFTNHQVSLDGRTAYGMMTSAAQPLQLPDGVRSIPPVSMAPSAPAAASAPSAPCCGIVAVDATTAIVTAKVNATGNVFQFKPNGFSPIDGLRSNPGALASLKPGQAVYANFTNHQVSLDGRTVCCTMTSGRQAAQNAFKVLSYQTPNFWTTQAPMPTARGATAAGVVNGILYVVGGQGPSAWLATVEAYDPATNTWTTKAPMLTARSSAAAGVVNGILYVAGGDFGASSLATVEAYDPATNTWTVKAPMPTARAYATAGVVNGILYVSGGAGMNVGSVATVEAYDPATNTWTAKAPMLSHSAHASSGVVNGILYVAGGSQGSASAAPATGLKAYDPATNTWTEKAAMRAAREAPAAGVMNGILYVAGGFIPNAHVATVEAYNPATHAWTTKAPMLTARSSAAAGVVNGILYIAGGYGPSGIVATVEAYQP